MSPQLRRTQTIAILFVISLLCLLLVFSLYPASAQEVPLAQVSIGVELYDLAWSPDSQLLAVSLENGVKIFSADLQPITELHGHTGHTLSVSWKPDGTQLATGGGRGDTSIRIWNYDSVSQTFTPYITISLVAEWSWVWLVSWSPDGNHLAALGIIDSPALSELGVNVRVWNTNTWTLEMIAKDIYFSPTHSLEWSQDSAFVVGGAKIRCVPERADCPGGLGGAFQISLTDGSLARAVDSGYVPGAVSLSSKGQLALDYVGLMIYDATTNQHLSNLELTGSRSDWSPTGEQIAAYNVGEIQVVDVPTGAVLRSFTPAGFWSLKWSPDGTRIATGSDEGIIQIWDASNLPDVSSVPTLTPFPTATAE